MTKKVKTPKDLAAEQQRKTYSFSLNETNAEALKRLASKTNVSFSAVVDEAIRTYLEAIKER